MKTDELITEALSLPVEERVHVAETLLKSMNPIEQENEKKWIKKAKDRLHELQSESIMSVPGQQVFDKVWKRY